MKFYLFYGPNKGFNKLLEDMGITDYIKFTEIISQYNETIRASNVGFLDSADRFYTKNKEEVENLVINHFDFASVVEHVLSNFTHIITHVHKIENIIIQNPPKRVFNSIMSEFESTDIEIINYKYKEIETKDLSKIYSSLKTKILSQENAILNVVSALYKRSKLAVSKPTTLHFYGPSGVGKTELSKVLSRNFNGELTRIQFSMMGTNDSYNYIYGGSHNKPSLASDLLLRESNIILIDEFDKVHTNFYNAFYEVFDEGIFSDLNYKVHLENAVFILTSNFNSIDEILKVLGPALFSRISKNIKFNYLDNKALNNIIDAKFKNIFKKLNRKEVSIIEESGICDTFKLKKGNFKNIRYLDNMIENEVFSILTKKLIDI